MPPRRHNEDDTNTNNGDASNNNANSGMQELANLISGLVNQLTQANQSLTQNRGGANQPTCTFKHFNSCNPLKFTGAESATGLLQCNPKILEAAIRLSATLTDNHVKNGTLTRKGTKKAEVKTATKETKTEVKSEAASTSKSSNKKRKTRNFMVTAPAAKSAQQSSNNSTARNFTGNTPQCNTYRYHHTPNLPCRVCNNCGKFGTSGTGKSLL
ncbi:hypothetical protein R6Q59_025103 [Mikania micrantha]